MSGLLLSRGADVNAKANEGGCGFLLYTALSAGAGSADVSSVWACLFHRRTPLHKAAWSGHATVVALLLTHGADVDAKNNYGCAAGRYLFLYRSARRAAVADQEGVMHADPDTHAHMDAHTHAHP